MARIVEGWPEAVGPAIARNAWPARVARDGTLHAATADSVWAFELGQRGAEIAARLGVPRIRFAPGPLPEPAPEQPPRGIVPSPADEARARELAAAIEDENLRESVQKAVSFSLARERGDRPV